METMSVKMRQLVENEIIGRFVNDALAAGYRLAVSLDRGYDIDEMLLGSTDWNKIMEEAKAGDDCHIFVQPGTGPTTKNGRIVCKGWVYLVFGNDGWDVISDYTTNLEPLLKGANEISDKYQ